MWDLHYEFVYHTINSWSKQDVIPRVSKVPLYQDRKQRLAINKTTSHRVFQSPPLSGQETAPHNKQDHGTPRVSKVPLYQDRKQSLAINNKTSYSVFQRHPLSRQETAPCNKQDHGTPRVSKAPLSRQETAPWPDKTENEFDSLSLWCEPRDFTPGQWNLKCKSR